jgi:hypothetical protein
MESMTLAFPDPDKRICVLTDASDRFYAGLVTKIDEEKLDLPMEEKDHQPLAFLSGEFKGACSAARTNVVLRIVMSTIKVV